MNMTLEEIKADELVQWALAHASSEEDAQDLVVEAAERALRALNRRAHGGCPFCGM